MKICPHCGRRYNGAETRFCAEDGQALVEQANRIAPSQPPAAQQSAAPFSASLAMTLFAHRFIENVPPENHGIDSFCQPNTKVNASRFVAEVPVIAFWQLFEANCIRFTPMVKAGFIRNSPTLVIEANPAGQIAFPGLEYDFWEIIKRSPGKTVEWVFAQFLGGRDRKPETNLAARLIQWMIQLGYGQPDNSPKPFFRMGAIPLFEKFAPDCRSIAAQEQAAREIHGRWMKFRAAQRELFYYLYDDVVDAALDRMIRGKHSFSDYSRAEDLRDSGTI